MPCLVRNNADVFNIEHVFMEASEVSRHHHLVAVSAGRFYFASFLKGIAVIIGYRADHFRPLPVCNLIS
jgi:hypothetical protein